MAARRTLIILRLVPSMLYLLAAAKQVAELRETFDIMRAENVQKGYAATDEFPRVPNASGLNRQQCRALERVQRKAARKHK